MTKPKTNEAAGHEVIATPGLIEIFRAGKHTTSDGRTIEFTNADIATIAASYDPALSEAPLVVGHPELNAPAYGWAKSLTAQGASLFAEPHQVDADFAEMVNAGRFKKRSASIFMPDTAGNPTPGKHYLRHIGFLGAAAPAVKGLRPASFADGGQGFAEFADWSERNAFSSIADLFSRVRDYFIERDGVDAADKVIAEWQLNQVRDAARPSSDAAIPSNYADVSATDTEETLMSDANKAAEFAAQQDQLTKQKQDLADREAVIAKREGDARRADAANFVDGLVKDGKLLPRQKAAAVELFMSIDTSKVLNFASPDQGAEEIKKPAADVLRELLNAAKPVVNFSERSAGDITEGAANFSTPAGAIVDGGRLELHHKAIAYQTAHPNTSYVAAVAAVGG